MNKARRQKYNEKQRLLYKDKPCATCGKEHDHTYGTGKFCSKKCAGGVKTPKRRSAKVHAHLELLRKQGKINKRSPHGTWTCQICHVIFETQRKLNEHCSLEHGFCAKNHTLIKTESGWQCPYCHKEFEKRLSAIAHNRSCPNHPNKKMHDIAYKQQGQTYSAKIATGEIIPPQLGKSVRSDVKERIMKTFEERSSRGDYTGHYKGYYYESSFELAWIAYNLDHGIQFSRCDESFEYYDSKDGKWRLYFPDFIMPDGTIIEIKGYYTQNTADKMQAVILDYKRNIILFEEQDLKCQLEYCKNTFGKDFAKTLRNKP